MENDSIVSMGIEEIRIANRIFTEHKFLIQENAELKKNNILLNSLIGTKDNILNAQVIKINTLQDISSKQSDIIQLNNSIIANQKEMIKAEKRSKWKYAAGGGVIGALIATLILAL